MRTNVPALGGFAVLACIGLAGAAQAASPATSNLTVTITIINECTAGATTPVAFGSQGVLAANIDATGTISVTCTTGAPYTISLNAGTGGGTTTTRKMAGSGAATGSTVDYKLFSDSARSLNWGNTAGEIVSRNGTGSAETIDVYGRVPPAATTPVAGSYSDTVQVSIAY